MSAKIVEASPVSLSWKVGGMDCASCAAKIRGAVERMPGVSDVKLAVMTETLSLSLDERQTGRGVVEAKVNSLGYTTTPIPAKSAPGPASKDDGHGCGHDHDHVGHHGHDHDHKHDHAPNLEARHPPPRLMPAMACRDMSTKQRPMA